MRGILVSQLTFGIFLCPLEHGLGILQVCDFEQLEYLLACTPTSLPLLIHPVHISFGKGIFGQLGYGEQESSSKPKKVLFNKKQNLKYEQNEKISIIDIKCGGEHSLFLSSNNHLYACGHGYLGQLGFGNNKNINSPLIVQSLTNKKIIDLFFHYLFY